MNNLNIAVYDYNNKPTYIPIPDKEIKEIYVNVQSGDETGTITFQDGESIHFDASSNRTYSYDDGDYTVTGDNIQKWIDFVPPLYTTASYNRLNAVRRWLNDETEYIQNTCV